MRRAAFLAGLLLFVPALWAQEAQTVQPVPASARQAGYASLAPGMAPQEAAPAPASDANLTPGHPLGPRDIDILTGKADRESRAQYDRAYPYVYMYGQDGMGYGSRGAWRRGVPFSAFGFRRFGGRGFGGHGFRVFTVPPRPFFHF